METNNNAQDISRALAKGVISTIPGIGPIISEVLFSLIPEQRITRLESFFEILDTKLEEIDKEKLKLKFNDPENIDLLEDGMLQAVRALSEERKDYIATLIKNGITNEQFEHNQYKRLLSILGELNDVEIIFLRDYSIDSELGDVKKGRDELNVVRAKQAEFRNQHEDLFKSHSSLAGMSYVPQLWMFNPKDEFIHSCHNNLLRLGLLDQGSITFLGCMLLISIDQGIDNYQLI